MSDTCTGCPYLYRYTAHNMRYEYVPEEEDWFEAAVAQCSYLDEYREIMRIPYKCGEDSKRIEAEETCDAPLRPSWCKLYDREDSHFIQRFMHKD